MRLPGQLARVLIYNFNKQVIYRNYSKFSEHVILDEQTVTGRLLHYLTKNNEQSKTNVKFDYLPKDPYQLHKLDKRSFLNNLCMQNLGKKDLSKLDSELCLRLKKFDFNDTFKVLSLYMKISPNYITEYPFYNQSIDILYKNVDQMDKESFIQFIFFVGLLKKVEKSQQILRKCLKIMSTEFINNLKTEELCIICNSTFKTSTKIKNKLFLDKVKNCLNDNLYLLKDPAFLITLIKTIRHNRYQDDNLMGTISCGIFFNKTLDCYSFPALCHILALFADYNYCDEVICETFTEKCLNILRNFNDSDKKLIQEIDNPRVKDIKRFLWCLSILNYKKLNENDIRDVIIPKLFEKIEDLQSEQDSLTEIMLYLWMLGYHAIELVPHVFNKYTSKILASKPKLKERFNLLLHCIYFEDKKLFRTLNQNLVGNPTYPIEKQLKKRPLLEKVFKTIKNVHESEINRFELTCEVPYLNVVGITGYRKHIYKAVYIEVLDEYTTLKNCRKPTGAMALKLRILDGLEEAVIVVSEEESEIGTISQLEDYLRDEINLLC